MKRYDHVYLYREKKIDVDQPELPLQEWNKEFNRTWTCAANTVLCFAEQAELQQLGEFLASAQQIAEQGEAVGSGVWALVAGGVEQRGGDSDRRHVLIRPGRGGHRLPGLAVA